MMNEEFNDSDGCKCCYDCDHTACVHAVPELFDLVAKMNRLQNCLVLIEDHVNCTCNYNKGEDNHSTTCPVSLVRRTIESMYK